MTLNFEQLGEHVEDFFDSELFVDLSEGHHNYSLSEGVDVLSLEPVDWPLEILEDRLRNLVASLELVLVGWLLQLDLVLLSYLEGNHV